ALLFTWLIGSFTHKNVISGRTIHDFLKFATFSAAPLGVIVFKNHGTSIDSKSPNTCDLGGYILLSPAYPQLRILDQ
ncbi:hypothetical protein K2P47_05020, partial [Patescibacteria group bacterium]|nr:hypothetical protein [Patescibacteria group bacterium]